MPWLPDVHALDVGITPPFETKIHADVHRGGMAHHADIRGRIDIAGRAIQKHRTEIANGIRAARAGTIGDADTTGFEERVIQEASVSQREFGCPHGHLRHATHGTGRFA